MALQRTSLTKVLQLAASAAAIYTNAAGAKAHVKGVLLHNTDTVVREVSVYWVQPSGGAVGSATLATRIFCVSLAAKETLTLEVPFALVLTATNETIQAVAASANVVNAAVLGDQDA